MYSNPVGLWVGVSPQPISLSQCHLSMSGHTFCSPLISSEMTLCWLTRKHPTAGISARQWEQWTSGGGEGLYVGSSLPIV